MTMAIAQVCEWLETTPIALFVRESLWGFPIVVAVHILGLVFSAGMVIWFDLRLLGLSMAGVPVSTVYRRLAPLMLTGFAVMFVSGVILAISYASAAYGNLYFRIKMLALLLAALNALAFHRITERTIAGWNEKVRPPLPARLAGVASIVLWAVVIMAGRLMSYTMF